MMNRIFYIDSENVGDVWVPLLLSSDNMDEFLVFYTDKSPCMHYETVRKFKETQKEVTFIKCYEGTNGLDFQLVTELGYRLHDNSSIEHIIVSNDNGFNVVAKYWTQRGAKVKKIISKDCLPKEFATSTKSALLVNNQKDSTHVEFPKYKEVSIILSCLGKDHLLDIHNSLVLFFGKDSVKNIYKDLKDALTHDKNFQNICNIPKKEKFQKYSELVFFHSSKAEMPKDFSLFVFELGAKRKNLNSFRAALTAKYGKTKGPIYYDLFKQHIKIMNKM